MFKKMKKRTQLSIDGSVWEVAFYVQALDVKTMYEC